MATARLWRENWVGRWIKNNPSWFLQLSTYIDHR